MTALPIIGTRTGDDVRCPNCRGVFSQSPGWPTRCDLCGATVAVLEFDPPIELVDEAKAAMPDDVACAFHPGKRAETICDGTGSYICSLCAVPVGGKTYSTEFINSGGLKTMGKGDVFERTLQRPDYNAGACLALSFLLGWTGIAPLILLPVGAWYYSRHLKLAKSSSLYAKATSRWTTPLLGTLYALILILFLLGVTFAIIGVATDGL
ncbi:MAG: hypothetical protein AAF916_02885 [Planctomycetota bacterium]